MASSVSTTEYLSFDILGRVTQSRQTTDGTVYGNGITDKPMTYTYDLAGDLIEQQYPSGRVVKNVLDANGELATVESKKNAASGFWHYADSFSYAASGAVTAMQLGNGHWESTQYNSRLQPTQIALGTVPDGSDLLKLDYNYGTPTANNGNVLSQTITVPAVGFSTGFTAVQTYTYDELNRLKSADEKPNGWTQTQCNNTPSKCWKQTFIYDRYGNRNFDRANTTMPASFSNPAVSDPSVNTANNRLNSTGYNYDNAGSMIADASGHTYTYDSENKQTQVTGATGTLGQYWYDGDGRRVKKYVPGTGETTVFLYDVAGKQVAEYSTIVASVATARVNYLTTDHLGSPRINTDQNGAVITRHDYHPFGEEIDGTGGRTTGVGYGDDSVRKQFTGYEREKESNLDFAQARYYNFSLGRFTSPDPYKIMAEIQYEMNAEKATSMLNRYISQPQQWNQYPYTINNPYKFIDPSGEIIWLSGTQEERNAALKRIRNILGEERFALVRIDADGSRLYLSNNDVAKMQNIGDDALNKEFSTGMAEILNSSDVVEFRVTEKFTNVNGYEIDLNTPTYAGGLTVSGKDSSSGNIQIFVHPQAGAIMTQEAKNRGGLRNKTSDGKDLAATNEMVDAHEFGHAWDRMRSQGPPAMSGGHLQQAGWKVFENAVRSRNPNNSQRRTEH